MYLQDRMNLNTKRVYTDEGYLIVPAKIARTGIQKYRASEMGISDGDPNRIISVYRPPEEVFSDASLSSFSNKPVTDDHPPELVNASNSKKYTVGHSGPEVKKIEDFAETELFVTDALVINKINDGKVELSNGYVADIDWTPGVSPDGEPYEAMQRNIRGNHIAIVTKGRAGSACRVADNSPTTGDESVMAKVTIDGVDYDVSEQAAQAIGKEQQRLADAEKEAQKEKDAKKEAEDELAEEKEKSKKTEDSMQAKIDDALSKVPSAESLDKMVADRAEFISKVSKIAPNLKWEGKDELTIKREVVTSLRPNVQMDSKGDSYVEAAFDLIVDGFSSNPQQALDNALSNTTTKDSETTEPYRPASLVARDKFVKESRNLYKGGAK